MIHYRFTDKEIDEILKSLTIIMDTREKSSMHIIEYFKQKDIPMKLQKLDTGDYSFMIPSNEDTQKLGITRDLYFNSYVERKNSIDELCNNLTKDNGKAFENELIRAQGSKFVLFVEDPLFDRNIAQQNYRSRYKPQSLRGRLDSLQAKYNFEIRPVEKDYFGHVLYHRFKYQARRYLKIGVF